LTEMLDRLYLPDGKNLNVMLWGQAGSGKTFFMENTLQAFLSSNKDPKLRVLYISPKNEGFAFADAIVGTVDQAEEKLREKRVVALYPSMEGLEAQVDDAINMVFDFQATNKETSWIVIIDDAQVFLSSRRSASDAHKRLALTGRSRMIRGIYVAHNVVFARELEGQVDLLVGFSNPNPIYYRQAIERFDFDPEPFSEALRERPYSFVWFDTRSDGARLMSPIE